jgi:hypothetical protein
MHIIPDGLSTERGSMSAMAEGESRSQFVEVDRRRRTHGHDDLEKRAVHDHVSNM